MRRRSNADRKRRARRITEKKRGAYWLRELEAGRIRLRKIIGPVAISGTLLRRMAPLAGP